MKTLTTSTLALGFALLLALPSGLGQSLGGSVPAVPVSTPVIQYPNVSDSSELLGLFQGTEQIAALAQGAPKCHASPMQAQAFGVTQYGLALIDLRACVLDSLMSQPTWLSITGTGVSPDAFTLLAEKAEAYATANPQVTAESLVINAVDDAGLGTYSTIDDVPTPYVAFLILTAMPDGPQTKFHLDGYGSGWTEIAAERYQGHTDDLLMAEYGRTNPPMSEEEPPVSGYIAWGQTPNDATFTSTRATRADRLLAGIAYLETATYQANKNGNLGNSFDALGPVAIAVGGDSGALYADSVRLGNPDPKLGGISVSGFSTFVHAIGTAARLNVNNDLFLGSALKLAEGDFFDSVSILTPGSNGKTSTLFSDVAAMVEALVLVGQPDVYDIFNSGGLSSWGIVGSVTRNLPDDAAATEAASTAWSVHASEGQATHTSYSWNVPIQGMGMSDGVFATLTEDPTVFQEDGTIIQYTRYEALKAVVESQQPSTTYHTKNVWGCAFFSFTAAGAFVGTVFGAATGPEPLTKIAWIYAGAMALLNVVFTDKSDCDQVADYNAGFYHETGGFINYWGAFGWLGEGISLAGGLVQIYGTVTTTVKLEYLEATPYDNAPDIYGYYHGRDTAADARSVAEDIATANLGQFRPIAGLPGTASITIEILCAGYGDIYIDSSQPPPAAEAASTVCLRVEVGSRDAGPLEADPSYGAVDYHVKGVGSSGYVKVNGNTVVNNAPVEVNADGDGANLP